MLLCNQQLYHLIHFSTLYLSVDDFCTIDNFVFENMNSENSTVNFTYKNIGCKPKHNIIGGKRYFVSCKDDKDVLYFDFSRLVFKNDSPKSTEKLNCICKENSEKYECRKSITFDNFLGTCSKNDNEDKDFNESNKFDNKPNIDMFKPQRNSSESGFAEFMKEWVDVYKYTKQVLR